MKDLDALKSENQVLNVELSAAVTACKKAEKAGATEQRGLTNLPEGTYTGIVHTIKNGNKVEPLASNVIFEKSGEVKTMVIVSFDLTNKDTGKAYPLQGIVLTDDLEDWLKEKANFKKKVLIYAKKATNGNVYANIRELDYA